VKDIIIGKKRTAIEAGFSKHDKTSLGQCTKAIQLQHIRDYAYNEMKGGAKGETADYILYDTGSGNALQFLPIVSKLKLNKKRKVINHQELDQATIAAIKPEISHIVMASRAYSKDEAKSLHKMFSAQGDQLYRVASSMAPFEGKDDVKNADRSVADVLKEMFRHYLPKVEVDEVDAEMAGQEDEDDDDLYGLDDSNAGDGAKKESAQAK